MKKKAVNLVSTIGVFVALLLFWHLLIIVLQIPPFMLPSPYAVLLAIINRYPSLLNALWITACPAIIGLAASTLIGLFVSILFAQSLWVRKMFFPYTLLLQTVPIVAIAPLILMWVGAGLSAITIITFIICLPPIIYNTTQGLITVDRNLLSLFMMHNASRFDLMRKLRLPNALPSLFVGIRISAGIAVIGGLTGELFAGSSQVGQGGLGYSLMYAYSQLQTDYLFALVIAACVLGFAFNAIARFFEWLLLHEWHESILPEGND